MDAAATGPHNLKLGGWPGMAAGPPAPGLPRKGIAWRWARAAADTVAAVTIILCSVGLFLILRSWALRTPFPSISSSLRINLRSASGTENAPEMPTKVFILIHHNRTGAANSWRTKTTIEALGRLGLHDIELVHGRPTAEEAARHPCFAAINGPCAKFSLEVAFQKIYRRIVADGLPGAWVLEDDAIFHDRFAEVLPRYWAQVSEDLLKIVGARARAARTLFLKMSAH